MNLKKLAPVSVVAALLLTASLSVAAQTAPAAAPTTVPPMNGVAHIAIRVKDIAASVAFYHKLGFDQAFANMAKDGTTVTQSFLKLNDHQYIELYPVTDRDNRVEFLHLCFEGVDLNAIHDYYVAEGLTPISVRTAGAGNLLFTMKGPQQFADPQNIEYTQYMPGSKHTLEFGKLNGPDRVGDKMTVIALAMQDPAAARDYYLTKLGFTASTANPARLDLPGTSGESVEIVPVSELGSRSSIVLTSPDLDKSAAQLTRQQVEFKRASASATDGKGKTRTNEMISVTDPDGNIIRIQSAK
ncbi:MAG TPA: VOC family protein [Acidobacteriaceae bacterium]|jgi:catechol 2,3-dioxygenase-like lactoylglutathione lyase family enzyme